MIWDLFSFIKINKQDFYTMGLQCGIYHMDDNMPYAFFSKILLGNEVSNINCFILLTVNLQMLLWGFLTFMIFLLSVLT